MADQKEACSVKASIKKHPIAWVVGALLAGGLFLSGQIKGGAAKVRSKI